VNTVKANTTTWIGHEGREVLIQHGHEYPLDDALVAANPHFFTAPEPTEPTEPTEPVELVELVEPVEPVELVEPSSPVEPVELVEPVEPARTRKPRQAKGV
jgi:hypothetical protein